MSRKTKLGGRVRALRRRQGLTQAALAGQLGISASYLNLIEHDRRPLTAALLIRLARQFDLDLRELDSADDARLREDLAEALGDPLFEDHPVLQRDLDELLAATPDVARALRHLYHAYLEARRSAQTLAERALDGAPLSGAGFEVGTPSVQVSDFLQNHHNYLPELEQAAERLWQEAGLDIDNLFDRLARHLERRHGVQVRIANPSEMQGALRRFDRDRRELALSLVLRRGSRNFQLAHQLGLLGESDTLDRLADDAALTSAPSRALARVALANYFAAAVLMPYGEFACAAREERYDLDLLGHRFRASFEQVCHRLTTLRRRGDEGVPFHMVRVDLAGNISKELGDGRIRFPRFSGLCPLWSVHGAFLRPGMIRVQVSRLPGGTTFFSVSRTVHKHRGGYHAPSVLHAISLGCDLESARALVYADGIDLGDVKAAVPVGMTCRLCDRTGCQARVLPPIHAPLQIDEDIRGTSFYTPPPAARER